MPVSRDAYFLARLSCNSIFLSFFSHSSRGFTNREWPYDWLSELVLISVRCCLLLSCSIHGEGGTSDSNGKELGKSLVCAHVLVVPIFLLELGFYTQVAKLHVAVWNEPLKSYHGSCGSFLGWRLGIFEF